MLTMSCADVQRELSAFHDDELPVGARIALADHLGNCPGCAIEASDLASMREALRASHHREQVAWGPALARLESDIIERLAAEKSVSLATTGAAVAAWLLLMFGMCQLGLGTVDHPDSLANLLEREQRARPVRDETAVVLPRANPESIMPAAVMDQGDGDESLSAFFALVRSNGQLAELEFLGGQAVSQAGDTSQKQWESDLLAAASTASFQPARQAAGEAVPLNVVWILTHRTVRAIAHARIDITSTFRLGRGISPLPVARPRAKTV